MGLSLGATSEGAERLRGGAALRSSMPPGRARALECSPCFPLSHPGPEGGGQRPLAQGPIRMPRAEPGPVLLWAFLQRMAAGEWLELWASSLAWLLPPHELGLPTVPGSSLPYELGLPTVPLWALTVEGKQIPPPGARVGRPVRDIRQRPGSWANRDAPSGPRPPASPLPPGALSEQDRTSRMLLL